MTALFMVGAPFLAAAAGLAVGGRSRRAAAAVAVVGTAAALLLAVGLMTQEPWLNPLVGDGFGGRWDVLPFSTLVDGLAGSVAVMVGLVALLVQVYSAGYMRGEPRYASYSAFISLFTSAMLLVVVAGDLLTLVVGWEVMGLCSYLLIGHYWEREEARGAAVKAFLVTKTGDVGFILGVVVLGLAAGGYGIVEVTQAAAAAPEAGWVVAGTLLLLCGVAGKSAQFPLHAWLPDAMAGPSPVSALIHAATMVAAGVYVVLRLYPAFAASEATLAVLAVVGCVTMLGAALAALAQDDLKRVLAWSTVSQLAYMVAAAGVGAPEAATFHLLSHAFFKSLLFLGAGAVIHAVGSNLMRDMGGLRRTMPVTFWTMTIGLLSLAGLPPLSGWFSKESILVGAEHAGKDGDWLGWLVLVVGLVTVAVTAAYVVRLWALTFLGAARGRRGHEAPALMRWPLVVLAVPAALFGWLAVSSAWLPTWTAATATQPGAWSAYTPAGVPGEGVPDSATLAVEAWVPEPLTAALSLLALVVGAGMMGAALRRSPGADPARRLGGLRSVLLAGFGVDAVYRALVVRPFELVARVVDRFDRSVVTRAVHGAGVLALDSARGLQAGHRGDVQRSLSATLGLLLAVVVVAVVAVTT